PRPHRRGARLEGRARHRRAAKARRGAAREAPEGGAELPRREGQGARLLRRPAHEGHGRQGGPRRDEPRLEAAARGAVVVSEALEGAARADEIEYRASLTKRGLLKLREWHP